MDDNTLTDRASSRSPRAVGPSGPRFYRPELDVLRFAAFALVFARHTVGSHNPVLVAIGAAGRSGVCLFFLLSAYLITVLFDREEELTGQIDLKQFYIRRMLRIWPLYFAVLLLAWVLDIHNPSPQWGPGRMSASLLLVGNWYTFWFGFPVSFASVLWSVSVEEQFYLLWPWIRRTLGRRALMVASVATLPLSYLTIVLLCQSGQRTDQQLWVNTFVQAQFFGLGSLLALLMRDRSPRVPGLLRAVMAATGCFCLVAPEYYFHEATVIQTAPPVLLEYLMMAVGSVFLFFSVLGFGALGKMKTTIYLGKISYGLYVFHMLAFGLVERSTVSLATRMGAPHLVAGFFRDSTGFLLTVMMAHLSYRYFESFFLRLKERFTRVASRSI